MRRKQQLTEAIKTITLLLLVTFLCISSVEAREESNDTSLKEGVSSIQNVQSSEASLVLENGWNFISVPKRLDSTANTAMIFEGVNSDGRSIWTYESDGAGSGSWITLASTDKITPLNGYWVFSANPVQVPLVYSQDPLAAPPLRDLKTGWNAIGFASLTPATARDALLSAKKSWVEIIGFDAKSQSSLPAILNGGDNMHSEKSYLTPMQGYWCLVNDSCMYAALTA